MEPVLDMDVKSLPKQSTPLRFHHGEVEGVRAGVCVRSGERAAVHDGDGDTWPHTRGSQASARKGSKAGGNTFAAERQPRSKHRQQLLSVRGTDWGSSACGPMLFRGVKHTCMRTALPTN